MRPSLNALDKHVIVAKNILIFSHVACYDDLSCTYALYELSRQSLDGTGLLFMQV